MAVVQYALRLRIRRHQRPHARSSAVPEVDLSPSAPSAPVVPTSLGVEPAKDTDAVFGVSTTPGNTRNLEFS